MVGWELQKQDKSLGGGKVTSNTNQSQGYSVASGLGDDLCPKGSHGLN